MIISRRRSDKTEGGGGVGGGGWGGGGYRLRCAGRLCKRSHGCSSAFFLNTPAGRMHAMRSEVPAGRLPSG